jgi:xanthosine utilization system XapX-like protein
LLSFSLAIVNGLLAGVLYSVGILQSKTSMTLAMLPALGAIISYFLLIRALTRTGPPFDRVRWWWPWER